MNAVQEQEAITPTERASAPVFVLDFSQITLDDLDRVGGKNASLGEMFRALRPEGVGVLDGFATTAEAYRRLLATGGLGARLRPLFSDLD
ncbi:MAG: PEP/pyruvate-binding domain-containing protein, partial [Thermoanaerobaculia bacterium]